MSDKSSEDVFMNKKFISSLVIWLFFAAVITITGVRTAITCDLNGPYLGLFAIVTLYASYILIASLIKILKNRGE